MKFNADDVVVIASPPLSYAKGHWHSHEFATLGVVVRANSDREISVLARDRVCQMYITQVHRPDGLINLGPL